VNKIPIKTVFLDMDGVLTNFRKGVYKAFNIPYDFTKENPNYEFWESWGKGATWKHVHEVCNSIEFWANLEWMPDGLEIYSIIRDKFETEQIYLLTNPLAGGDLTSAGKMKWIKKHLPDFYRHTIITASSKGLLAKPGTLLIDDHDKNVNEFKEAGGSAILVPQPWNKADAFADLSLEIVNLSLRHFTTERKTDGKISTQQD